MVGRITIDMNRVEGDLEVQLDVEDNTVRDSWCVGTMYRGYEQILVGRAPSDVLVIVPRVCGICSTAQLYAGVRALEDAWGVRPAPNGVASGIRCKSGGCRFWLRWVMLRRGANGFGGAARGVRGVLGP